MINSFLCIDTAPIFLKIFDFSAASPILFYAFVPIIFVVLFLGIFIFIKDKFSLKSKLLLLLGITFSVWLINMIFQWINANALFMHFAWQITTIIEIFIPILTVYFVSVFLNKDQDISFRLKIIFSLIISVTAILLPTNWNMYAFDISDCESLVGPLLKIVYLFEIFCAAWIMFICVKKFRQINKDDPFRKEIVLLGVGTSLFLIIFSISNLLGEWTNIYSINFMGPIGMVIFLSLLTYMIVRFKTFNIKLIATQALVWALVALIGAEFFFISGVINYILVGVTFVAVIVFGWLLIKSVKKEVEQRELIEKIEKELEKAYATEKRANEELKQLAEVKNQFLMTIQHHLRTPLTSMRGYSDLLLSGSFGKIPKKMEPIIQKFEDSTTSLIKMVNDFLDITQFQLGKNVISEKDGVNLAPILEEIIGDIKLEAEKKGLQLKLEKPEGDCIIKADESKLKAALVNIFDNSVKYTEKGSVTMELKIESDKVRIEIKDTGMGIAKERLAKLFDSTFERTEQAKKTFTTGRGIGLYLSSQIVKAHNGKIWAESEGEGKGSTFIIELPKN